MNLFALMSVLFTTVTKIGVNELKIALYDLILVANSLMLLVTLPIIIISRELTFVIPKKNRRMFFLRCFLGWILI